MKHDSRNLKYGGTAAAVSVILIAAIILINVIFTALSAKYSFYTDMTSQMTYTLSEEAKEVLSDVTEQVKIIFCHDKDYIESDSQMRDIMLTAENLDREFEWLSVEFVNTIANPNKVSKYKLNSSDPVYTTHVIVESGEEWRKLSRNSFFVVDTDEQTVWGLQAEEKFASAILGVTAAQTPIAYFTTGHGEEVSETLIETVSNAGYDVRYIDLMKENIDPDARLIIINGPQYDFSGGYQFSEDESGNTTVTATTSELEKIDKFLSQDYGSLMTFVDPYANDLTNLEQYLYEWGVVFDNNIVKDESQAVSIDGQSVVAEYCTDATLASNLIDEIATLATRPKTIFKNTSTISISPTFSEVRDTDDTSANGMGAPTGSFSSSTSSEVRDISPVFKTSASATVTGTKGEAVENAVIPGNLMTISRQTKIVNNEYFYSYVLCAGTVCFDDLEWTASNVYANEDVIYAALKQFGRENVPSGIGFKEYANYDIEDMTTSEADSWTVLLVTVLPVAFSVVGAVICIRRKYR